MSDTLILKLASTCLLIALFVTGVPTNHRQKRQGLDFSSSTDDSNDKDSINIENGVATDTNTSNCLELLGGCLHGDCDSDGKSCVCQEGWTGVACNLPCTLKCLHGECMVKPQVLVSMKSPGQITEDDMTCFCDVSYQSADCSRKVPDQLEDSNNNNRRLAIILGTCLSVVVIAGIIVPLLIWFRSSTVCKRKLHLTKTYEENDGNSFDAYISYSATSNAAQFVKEFLAPGLDTRGFKSYIPCQGQLGPDGKEEKGDILAAVKKSRRTILVMTRDYISDKEWQSLEMLYTDALNIYSEPQIIPVLLDDMKFQEIQETPKSLGDILESVECLEVPACWASSSTSDNNEKINLFWSRLEMAMPKRKQAKDTPR